MKTKKFLKSSLAVALIFGSVGVLAGCGKTEEPTTENESEQYQIYKLAVSSGYEGTYEEWLASIKGAKGDKGDDGHSPVVNIGNDGYWYVDGTSTGIKATGSSGESGKDGATWLSGTIAPGNDAGKNGDFYFDTLAKKIYNKVNGTWTLVTTIIDGQNGKNGKGITGIVKTVDTVDNSIDIYTITYTDNTTSIIRVKNGSDGAKGEDAKNVSFRLNEVTGFIQWAYVEEEVDEESWAWIDLKNIAELKGNEGDAGKTPIIAVNEGLLQWQYEGDEEWNTLLDLESLKGEDGKDGTTWLTGEGNPSVLEVGGKLGDFYFDKLNNDIYVFDGEQWQIEVDLEVNNSLKELVNGTYTGYVEGSSFAFDVLDGVIVGVAFDGESIDEVTLEQVNPSYEIVDGIINVTLSLEGEPVVYSYELRENNKLVKHLDEEEKDLLKGIYSQMDSEEYSTLTLSNTKFAMFYNYVAISGSWEIINEYDMDGIKVYTVLFENDEYSITADLSYFGRFFVNVSFDIDFTSRTYFDGESEYSLIYDELNGYSLKVDSEEPVSVNVYSYGDDGCLIYVENEDVSLMLNGLTGDVMPILKSYEPFVGEVIKMPSYEGYEIYVAKDGKMQIVDNVLNIANGNYILEVDVYQKNISIKDSQNNDIINRVSYDDLSDNKWSYTLNNTIVNIRFGSDYTVENVSVRVMDIWDGSKDAVPSPVENVISITTAEQLAALAESVNSGVSYEGITIRLENDIDLDNKEWTPIGYGTSNEIGTMETGNAFDGVFDGNGFTIYNLKITEFSLGGVDVNDNASAGVAFIGHNIGTVKNLIVDKAEVRGNHYVAAIVGFSINGVIDNCHVKNAEINSVYSNDDESGDKAGAVVAYLAKGMLDGDYASITNSSAENSTVMADRDAGQIIGCLKGAEYEGLSIDKVDVSWNKTGEGISGKSGTNITQDFIGRLVE